MGEKVERGHSFKLKKTLPGNLIQSYSMVGTAWLYRLFSVIFFAETFWKIIEGS